MTAKGSVDLRSDLAELVKRKAEIAVSDCKQFFYCQPLLNCMIKPI